MLILIISLWIILVLIITELLFLFIKIKDERLSFPRLRKKSS
jgi:hypothetical protein